MKTRPGTLMTSAAVVLVTLATAGTLAAQAGPQRQSRFILKDLGTLGGPYSSVAWEPHPLNDEGTVAGIADTLARTPSTPIASPTASSHTRSCGATEF